MPVQNFIDMERRKFLQSSFFAFLAFNLSAKKSSSLTDPAWKITMLNKDIGIFTETGGTILFHLSPSGIVVVDAQFPTTAPHLIEELKKKNQPFHLLINTHHHADHTSGNISFKPIIDTVLAHVNSLKNQKLVAERQNNLDKQYLPNKTFTTSLTEKSGNEIIHLNYYGAAHTDGDSVIHFERSNIAHVGDLVFNKKHPYIDRSAGANMHSWIEVLKQIRKNYNSKTLFVCGHAGEGSDVKGNTAMIIAFENYLSNSLKHVASQIKEGKPLDEIIKSTKSIPGSPEWKGEGIERTLTAAYEELTS